MALLGRSSSKLASDVLQNKFHRQLYRSINNVTQRFYRQGAYEGDGKTYVTILNEERDRFLINGHDQMGFKLNNGLMAVGPIILFPNFVFSWNVNELQDIHDDSLSLVWLLEEKPDILVIGYGDANENKRGALSVLYQTIRKHKIQLEILPTRTACTTYNFLASESRFVAAALIPPKGSHERTR